MARQYRELTKSEWLRAIIKIFEKKGGILTNQQVYDAIPEHLPLNEVHYKISFGVPDYKNFTRRYLTTLRRQRILFSMGRGKNILK